MIWNGTDDPIPYDKFQKNDIMVFERPQRPGAGHVGLYHSTNGKTLKVVSGNAGNTLRIDPKGRNPVVFNCFRTSDIPMPGAISGRMTKEYRESNRFLSASKT